MAGIMELMREFSSFKEKKEVEEMENVAKAADNTYLREELVKYAYSEEIVDKIIPAFQLVYDHNPDLTDVLFELLSAKETEIEKLVEHKTKFEEQTDPDAKQEDVQDDTEQVNLVDKILSEKYGVQSNED